MKRTPLLLAVALVAAGLAVGFVAAGRDWFAGRQDPSVDATGPVIERVEVERGAVVGSLPDGRPYGSVVKIHGERFFGTAFGPFVRFNGADAVAVILDSDKLIRAFAAPNLTGDVKVEVENPDHKTATVKTRFD